MPRTHSRPLIGRRFGRLKVVRETDGRTTGQHILWECACRCGTTGVQVATHTSPRATRSLAGAYNAKAITPGPSLDGSGAAKFPQA